ncbi:TolC family protein, partial [Burkholderia gladioli]|nr:TolC family protein [Burkholderia gladioli]
MKSPSLAPRHALTLVAAALALAGCTVGPNYKGAPPAPSAATFVRAPQTGVAVATPTPAAWWQSLNDPQLDELIAAALAHNPDLHAAQARLREARAQLSQQRANALPKTSADLAAIRTR